MPNLVGFTEQRWIVTRALLEPNRRYDLHQLLSNSDASIHIMNLIIVPEPDWKASGMNERFTLYVGEKPVYFAPVDVMKAEWQRYSTGQDAFFKRTVVPIRQNVDVEIKGKRSEVLDIFYVLARDVC